MKSLFLAITLAFASSIAFAQSKVDFKPSDTIKSVLERQVGSKVELKLESGERITGKVEAVGEKTVHISALNGAEYYDAVVVLEQISAVLMRTK